MAISIIRKNQLYFIFSFVGMIMIGTLLLKLPQAWRGEDPLKWVDAFFTSTSAVCVTGLTVVNVSAFTPFGQVLILLLIQMGGLGIMSISASLLLLMGKNLSMGSSLLSNLSDHISVRGIEGLVKTIFCYTLTIEAVGFVLLLPGFMLAGYELTDAVWYSVFHAVSAFCNAGFSTFDDSLIGVNAWVKAVVATLIVLGGLGSYVVYDLRRRLAGGDRLRVHSKLVLYASAILIGGGAAAIWISENTGSGGGIGWVDAFFMSVSARTAGFNTVAVDHMRSSSLAILIVLMQIGASPGSTGGGLRTTTAAIAVMAIIGTFKGRDRVLLFHREVPTSNVLQAFSLIVTYILVVYIGAAALEVVNHQPFQWAFFETTSALGTVGLALSSPPLPDGAKLLIAGMMFLGRVGLFTFMLFLLGQARPSRLTYPEEQIILN